MGKSVVSAALAVACALATLAAGHAPAFAQDFSITNPEQPANAGRRDLLRQLQAWWDMHAYYPRRASNNDEGGTVRLRLQIRADGNVWKKEVVASSGSGSLDAAAAAAFHGGFVQPLPSGAPDTEIELSLHYVLAHRHDQKVAAGVTPAPARRPFTITNDPVRSAILETMLQRTCTGTVVKQGIRNHPLYGVRYWAQAVFFRKPDGTPWIKFYEGGHPVLAPVTEVGKVVQWSGRAERASGGLYTYYQYTVWPDGNDNLIGNIEKIYPQESAANRDVNGGGTVDFSCATEIVPSVTWTSLFITPARNPAGDPP